MEDEKPAQTSYTERLLNIGRDSVKYFNTLADRLQNISRSNIEVGILQIKQGEFFDAALRFRIAAFFDKNNPIAHYMMGKAYVFGGKRDKAIAPLKRALQLQPSLNEAKFLLSICGSKTNLQELPRSFIIERNDIVGANYANIFPEGNDTNLIKKLRAEFDAYFESWQGFNVLDIGCQGGETGLLLREKANALVGVEPALRLAAIARQKRLNDALVYNKVVAKFPEDYIEETTEKFQVITAINYIGNFGALDEFFKQVRGMFVEAGGVFIFTMHPSQNAAFEFASNKILFQHSEKYVEEQLAANNFRLHKKTEITYESGVIDLIYIAETA